MDLSTRSGGFAPRHGRELAPLGAWGVLLMATVSLACIGAAVGLWTGRRAGYRLAAVLLVTNLLGDLANAVIRGDPRTLIGIPIAGGPAVVPAAATSSAADVT